MFDKLFQHERCQLHSEQNNYRSENNVRFCRNDQLKSDKSAKNTKMESRLSSALNETLAEEIMNNGNDSLPKRHVSLITLIVLTLVYVVGVMGNVSALIILYHKDKVCKNEE